ncbi:hypothetical protein IW967_08520 [Alicyclobacillus mali]|uniref:Transposase n=1 Tax=Alicyclobacillus mali (ex Roth et al. 2021) TaxID=1123961 RepID=A0ABS0F3N8_9BACL|nr:hypothetical protein [Alicyclobacillus mali (ex Roth et al. 2021)]MBF8377907.1 hypothetical protein [Alicyclobacillus mali (ex Roth et al. 2021)]MCL6488951.1 hypothetical protein [Alicyclobacillus mali (ex Roth et al. 2021)]
MLFKERRQARQVRFLKRLFDEWEDDLFLEMDVRPQDRPNFASTDGLPSSSARFTRFLILT